MQGGWGSYIFVPDTALCLGGLKGQDTRGWFLTTRCIYSFPWAYSSETSQGVPLDSLGVGAVKIGCIIAPDPSPTSPGSAEAHSGDGGGVFAFHDQIFAVWGPCGSYLFIPGVVMWMGGVKKQIIAGGL